MATLLRTSSIAAGLFSAGIPAAAAVARIPRPARSRPRDIARSHGGGSGAMPYTLSASGTTTSSRQPAAWRASPNSTSARVSTWRRSTMRPIVPVSSGGVGVATDPHLPTHPATHSAQLRVNASLELGQREGLGDVVVGAELERPNLVDMTVAAAQDDDRHVG